jgi:hypothetical protein
MWGKNGNAHKHASDESTQMCGPIDWSQQQQQQYGKR